MVNIVTRPIENSIGLVNWSFQNLHAGRDRDEHRGESKGRHRDRTDAGNEHVMGPHAPAHETNGDAREHDEGVTEDRLASEGWENFRHDSECRKDHQIHLRVTEDPEEVLPKKRIGSLRYIEEVGIEESIHHEQELRCGKNRDREQQKELRNERHPREDRHLHERHSGRTHVQDRHDEVDRTRE
jgi:hypothetical protein